MDNKGAMKNSNHEFPGAALSRHTAPRARPGTNGSATLAIPWAHALPVLKMSCDDAAYFSRTTLKPSKTRKPG